MQSPTLVSVIISGKSVLLFEKSFFTAKFEDLVEAKICYYGFRCFFDAEIDGQILLKSEQPLANGTEAPRNYKSGTGTEELKFEVVSMCGSETHQYFELRVTSVDSPDIPEKQLARKEKMFTDYSAFFTQDRKTGHVGRIYLSEKDQ